jgi:hypothetical protein
LFYLLPELCSLLVSLVPEVLSELPDELPA